MDAKPRASESAEPDDASAEQPAEEPTTVEPPPIPRTVVPRWIQAVVLPLALIGLYLLASAAGTLVLIVTFAGAVALILNPLVVKFSRWLHRGVAIVLAYLVVVLIFALIGLVLADPVASQLNHFSTTVPDLIKSANSELNSAQNFLNQHGFHVHISKQGSTALDTIQKQVLKQSGSIISFSKNILSDLVTLSVDGVLVLVLSVYMLVYARDIGGLFRKLMPPGNGTPEDDYPLLIQRALSSYVRGQLAFSLIMGASAAFSLWLFGVVGIFPDGSRFAVFFGAFYGLMELIPYVGPIIGPIPALAVALFTNPLSAVWVLILFVALQQLEGHVIAPQLFRISLRINPILVILALLLGDQLAGIAGALVALPVATVLRQTAIYLRDHLELEPWATRTPPS
ncbi:MAG: AI-2E family transporter [Solirubrobacterales bacterium]|nr:AI-2E family transporter [Solirubrobacterales bacterium]